MSCIPTWTQRYNGFLRFRRWTVSGEALARAHALVVTIEFDFVFVANGIPCVYAIWVFIPDQAKLVFLRNASLRSKSMARSHSDSDAFNIRNVSNLIRIVFRDFYVTSTADIVNLCVLVVNKLMLCICLWNNASWLFMFYVKLTTMRYCKLVCESTYHKQ